MSSASPHVDWVPQDAFGFPARLGLTCVPGVWREGAHVDADRRLREDLRDYVERS